MVTNRIDRLLEFLADDPKDPFLRFALASEYLKLGNQDAALACFEGLVDDCPDYVGTYYHLGKLYVRFGRLEDAMQTFNLGIEAASKGNDVHAASELRAAKMEIELEN